MFAYIHIEYDSISSYRLQHLLFERSTDVSVQLSSRCYVCIVNAYTSQGWIDQKG